MNPRYERELRELMKKMEASARPARRAPTWSGRALAWAARIVVGLARLRGEAFSRQLMLLSFGLALLAFLFGNSLPFVALAAAVAFVVAYVLFFVEARRPRHQPRWRGQIIEYRRPNEPFWETWWRRWRRRRW